jgi:lysophospholipase L1-like esterase
MKLLRSFAVLFFMLAITILSAEGAMTQENGHWKITGENYSATIGKAGYLHSIKVNGKEFLSSGKGIPGGTYLCHKKGISLPRVLKQTDANTLSGENEYAHMTYEFAPKKITVTITNKQTANTFYMIIDDAVKKVNYSRSAKSVPTTAALPAKATCSITRWFNGDAALDIIGSDRIWGPYKGHQVWQIRLKPEQERVVEFVPGVVTDAEKLAKSTETPAEQFTYTASSTPRQIPICMIGDSITWSGRGDHWRKYLIERLPRLAFVGTHSAVLGYAHAGEGGNGTGRVLGRMKDIPDCPYYSLLIGTNDTGVKDKAQVQPRAQRTAKRIQQIVLELLKKKGVEKVFLCSILPCETNNPLRDTTNSATNVILRKEFDSVFPKDKVVWIEFEKPIRAIKNWGPKIRLHPTLEGYKIIAAIHAEKLAETLGIDDMSAKVVAKPGTGVRVNNLWNAKTGSTHNPVIAGWYTISFIVQAVSGVNPTITVTGGDTLKKTFDISPASAGKRVSVQLFTGYEGYQYSRSRLKMSFKDCKVDRILFEKRRPSGKASIYGTGIYIDSASNPAPGELLENMK